MHKPSSVRVSTLPALECMAFWALKKHLYLANSSPVRPSKTKNFLQCSDTGNWLISIRWHPARSLVAAIRTWFKVSLSTWLTSKREPTEPQTLTRLTFWSVNSIRPNKRQSKSWAPRTKCKRWQIQTSTLNTSRYQTITARASLEMVSRWNNRKELQFCCRHQKNKAQWISRAKSSRLTSLRQRKTALCCLCLIHRTNKSLTKKSQLLSTFDDLMTWVEEPTSIRLKIIESLNTFKHISNLKSLLISIYLSQIS